MGCFRCCPKSAQRIAFHLLKIPVDDANRLASAIREAKARVRFCERCWNVAEADSEGSVLCPICADPRRDSSVICVVEEASDIPAIERTGEYRGLYHVLGGRLAPLDGVGPEDLAVGSLVRRVTAGGVTEVIIATNPKLEGEATALYLQEQLRDAGVTVSRLARGLPIGGDLEYADGVTIVQALAARRAM